MVDHLVYSANDLPSDLRWQIVSFLRIVWPEGFIGQNQFRDWISSEENHPIHIMLVEKGILISHTEVVWKYLEHSGQTYKAYGLSGVFTYPNFRGQGYGRQIIEAGTKYIKESDADIGIFHCDPSLKGFYTRSGWISMGNSITLMGPKDDPIISPELMMMLFLSEKGRHGQPSFESEPLYFGETTW